MSRAVVAIALILTSGCRCSESGHGTPSLRILEAHDAPQARVAVLPPSGQPPPAGWPLLLCLDPGAGGQACVRHLAPLSVQDGWLVAGSLDYRNGVSSQRFVPAVERELALLRAEYSLDPERVVLAGLSGGGMATMVIDVFSEERFAGFVVNSGQLHPNLAGDPSELESLDVPVVVQLLGTGEQATLGPALERDRALLVAAGVRAQLLLFEGGHHWAPVENYRDALAVILGE